MYTFSTIRYQIFLSFFWLIIFSSTAWGQAYIRLEGEIKHSENGELIPFATIRYEARPIGTVSNEWGIFSLNVPIKDSAEYLIFSSIGFELNKVRISTLLKAKPLTIELVPNDLTLDMVSIEAEKEKLLTPRQIVRQAVNRIPGSYSKESFILNGYYRDYLKNEQGYQNLYEAAIQIHDPGFQKDDIRSSNFNLLYAQYRSDIEVDPNVPLAYDNFNSKKVPNYKVADYGGNELSLLRASDPIRNHHHRTISFVYRMKKEFLWYHEFEVDSVLFLGDEAIYDISIRLKPRGEVKYLDILAPDAYVEGNILIKASDFSILNFQYTNFESQHERNILYELKLEYQEYDDKLYLKYISLNNIFYFYEHNPSPFKLKSIKLSEEKDLLELSFLDPLPSAKYAKSDLYRVLLEGNSLPVKEVTRLTQRTIRIKLADLSPQIEAFEYPEDTPIGEMLKDLLEKKKLQILLIDPVNGKKQELERLEYQKAYQYREFFVNGIEVGGTKGVGNIDKFLPMTVYSPDGADTFPPGFQALLGKQLK